MPSRVDAGETETAIDVWKEGKQGGSQLPYWAIVLWRYESLKGYIHYTLLHSYSGLNAHRVKKSIIELEHSSGAILFDFYSAAEVVGAPPLLFFLFFISVYFSSVCVYNVFVYFPLLGGGEGIKKYLFFCTVCICVRKKNGARRYGTAHRGSVTLWPPSVVVFLLFLLLRVHLFYWLYSHSPSDWLLSSSGVFRIKKAKKG